MLFLFTLFVPPLVLLATKRMVINFDTGRDLWALEFHRDIGYGLRLPVPGEATGSSEFTAGYRLVVGVAEFELLLHAYE